METDAALNLNFNVTIKVLDHKGHVIQTKRVHNKATRSLVSGIIQFLQGSFNPSQFNDPYEKYSDPEQSIINNAYGAKRFLPSCTAVGNIGIDLGSTGLGEHVLSINHDDYARPTYYETDLQREIEVPRVKFRRVRPTRGLVVNQSESLSLVTVLPKGYLLYEYDPDTGEVIHDENDQPVLTDDYFNYYGEQGTDASSVPAVAITEIGLYSNTSKDNGLLLARVLLDGYLKDGYNFTVTNGSDEPINIPFGNSAIVCPVGATVTVYVPKRYFDLVKSQLDNITGVTYTTTSTDAEAKKGVMEDPEYEYNPLIQTVNTSVIIEWKIGIISIGTNDEYIQMNTSDLGIPTIIPEENPPYDPYDGSYDATSKLGTSEDDYTLPTANKGLNRDVVVHHIPYSNVDNDDGGRTVSINS